MLISFAFANLLSISINLSVIILRCYTENKEHTQSGTEIKNIFTFISDYLLFDFEFI